MRVLAHLRPAAVQRVAWGANGDLPLELSTYVTQLRVPDELVSSVRCVVRAPSGIVVCHSRNGDRHIWPGGRLEAGESMTQAVMREVAEETGWQLERASVRLLGFLHLHHLGPRPDGYPYPYPDGLQLIFGGTATTRTVDADGDWTDTEGWEIASEVVAVERIDELDLSPLQLPVLRAFLPV